MALMHVNFFSDVLGMSMNMDVIIPQTAKNQIGMKSVANEGKLKTLYLLHGMSDDHTIWQRRTSIERYVSELGIAVVMPTTHLGWYSNMVHGLRYFDFVAKELPQICRGFFPQMSDKPEDNFVAGLSMGGYGALKLALLAPENFGCAGCLSAGFDAEDFAKDTSNPLWVNIFGDISNIKNSENDLFYVAEKVASSGQKLPPVYIWCGTEDFLYNHNTRMRDHLLKLGYDVTYEESSGSHQWECWDEKIQSILKWLKI